MIEKSLVIITGSPAVGKMAVGLELAKQIDYKLMHNHMTVDYALKFFDFNSVEFARLVNQIRKETLDTTAMSEDVKGLIFTKVINRKSNVWKKNLKHQCEEWVSLGYSIYLVELKADLSERLKRNKTALRIENKESKKDIKKSEEILLQNEKEWNMILKKEDVPDYVEKYISINNTKLSVAEVVEQIKEELSWN